MAKTEKRHPYGRKFGAGAKDDRNGGHLGQKIGLEILEEVDVSPQEFKEALSVVEKELADAEGRVQKSDGNGKFEDFAKSVGKKTVATFTRREGVVFLGFFDGFRRLGFTILNRVKWLVQLMGALNERVTKLETAPAPATIPAAADPKLREDLDARPTKGAVAEAIRDAVSPLGERVTALEGQIIGTAEKPAPFITTASEAARAASNEVVKPFAGLPKLVADVRGYLFAVGIVAVACVVAVVIQLLK